MLVGKLGDDVGAVRRGQTVLLAILERLAAYHRELEGMGVTREHLVDTTARIVQRTLTGVD